jgi:hypothetical protein
LTLVKPLKWNGKIKWSSKILMMNNPNCSKFI